MSAGSEFHTVGAATRKLRAPKLSLCEVNACYHIHTTSQNVPVILSNAEKTGRF